MLTDLWTGLGGKLADRVLTALLSPAMAFWVFGVLAWLHSREPVRRWPHELRHVTHGLSTSPGAVQLGVILALLAIALLSGQLVASLSMPTLRLLEGYWPKWLAEPRRRLVTRISERRKEDANRLRDLRLREEAELGSEDYSELVALDRRLRRIPILEHQLMPTRLGNVLRAAESRPVRKYGLDSVVCWPHLWLLLQDSTRGEIGAARARLDRCAAAVVWGVLLMVWTAWTTWAIPLAAIVVVIAYTGAVRAALTYADLVEAAWDLNRFALYHSLRWPLPANPSAEYASGRLLTAYLFRGSRGDTPTFE